MVLTAEAVHSGRPELVQTWRGCPSLLAQLSHASSSGADVFRAFVHAIDGVSQTIAITNEKVTDIGILCEQFGSERLSVTGCEFLAQHSGPLEWACRPEGPACGVGGHGHGADCVGRPFDHLTAQSSREIALLQAVGVKVFGAERFLSETIKVAQRTNADRLGEMIGKICTEMTWNQELEAIQKWVPASPVDEAIAVP